MQERREVYAYAQRCGARPTPAKVVSECRLRIPNVHGASEFCAYDCVEHCAFHDPAADAQHQDKGDGHGATASAPEPGNVPPPAAPPPVQ